MSRFATHLARLRADVDELYNRANRGAAAVQALQNRVYTAADAQGPATPTAASQIIIVAELLTAKVSGKFAVGFDLAYTGATAADTVQFQVRTQWAAAGTAITLAGGTNVGDTRAVGGHASVQVGTAAAGITITNGTNALLWWDTGTQVQPTAGTTGELHFSGIIDLNDSAGGFVAPGSNVVIYLTEGLSAGVTTFVATNAWAYELP